MITALLLALALPAPASDTLRLDLGTVMETARSTALSARLADSRSREMSAQVGEARSALLPHIGATASDVLRSYSTSTFGIAFPGFPPLVEPFNVQDARVTGRITLWDAAAWKRYRAAQRGEDKAAWDQKAGGDAAALQGAEAYLAVLRARTLLKARRFELDLAAQLDTLTRAQKKAGVVTQLEVLRAKSQLAAAQTSLAAASGDEEAARYTLLQILDRPLDSPVQTTDSLSLPVAARSPGGASLDSASADRPEVAAAESEVAALRAEVDAARSGLIPTVEAAGDYGLSGRRLNSGAQWTEDAALQLNWSLWDGGGREARVRQRKEQLLQAQLRLADLRSANAREARATRALLDAAAEQAARAGERAAFAEEEARLAGEKFRSGSSGNLEVITAQSDLSAAHEAYVNALYGYNRTRLEYLRSVHQL